ncbi:NPCBM/NEW2 domain-containing protein [uncultured Gimesia sp.]|uniref:NPCBM/NEW2 domain-containing protein n=1 Tax=uncultured Gimesia sp. TaxID=1678688 RepID=UPI0030DD1EBB|tara:strand:+ start:70029 stop:71195 length:1167 start_codon:yes stop_codon:yes gene_type:complete
MHSLFCISLTMLLAVSPEVEVTSLSGPSVSGNLQSLNETVINLKQEDASKTYPLSETLNVRFPKNRYQRSLEAPLTIRLIDGSRFPVQSLQSNTRQIKVSGDQTGTLILPTNQVSSIRFGTLNSNINASWEKLLNGKSNKDLLVVQKENVLDFIDGVVGSITDDKIQFFTGDDEVAVNRKRVFGIIYFRQPASNTPPFCSIHLTSGGLIHASSITYSGTEFEATLQSGARAQFTPPSIANLDFSQGKVRFLSDLEPRNIEYTPFFDTIWKYRKDKHRDGGPLRLDGKEYARGLYIHSKTLLQYRVKEEYRNFRAIMGIDDSVPGIGFVYVEIKGNGRTLYSGNVRSSDPPIELNLDVRGVRDFEILVDFGDNLEICDHLDLCEARLIK